MIESLLTLNISPLKSLLQERLLQESVVGKSPDQEAGHPREEPDAVFVPAHHCPLSDGPLNVGDTALHVAARLGKKSIVFRLVQLASQLVFATNQAGLRPSQVASTAELQRLLSAAETMNTGTRRTHFGLLLNALIRSRQNVMDL